jgi:hypothetical protein
MKMPLISAKGLKVRVAYPAKNETVSHPSYTLQVSAGEPAASVEVLIDEGSWQPCREALGLWWYDWSGYHASQHKVTARLCRADGTSELSEQRIFEVNLG